MGVFVYLTDVNGVDPFVFRTFTEPGKHYYTGEPVPYPSLAPWDRFMARVGDRDFPAGWS